MSKAKLPGSFLLFAVIALIFGSAILEVLLFQPIKYESAFAFAPYLIGSLYAAICLLGIHAVFFPGTCQRTFNFQKDTKSTAPRSGSPKTVQFKGHHPDCAKFSANRIMIRRAVLCAACCGLLVGAVVSLAGAFFYFFIGYNFLPSDPWIFVVGNAGMLLGLFQFKFTGYVKLAVNALFVVSSFVTLVMVDLLGKNLLLDLYVLGLILFFLATRILLSEFYNKKTCSKCKQCS